MIVNLCNNTFDSCESSLITKKEIYLIGISETALSNDFHKILFVGGSGEDEPI